MAAKDPITCHVLDTVIGKPAPNLKVTLTWIAIDNPLNHIRFSSITNADGRISNWGTSHDLVSGKSITVAQAIAEDQRVEDRLVALQPDQKAEPGEWSLTFETGEYYGKGNTFWPRVTLTFYVKPGEHYHVPLLLGPHSYTTYRGS
jgi:5-hydroxyisourate hydrolase